MCAGRDDCDGAWAVASGVFAVVAVRVYAGDAELLLAVAVRDTAEGQPRAECGRLHDGVCGSGAVAFL